MVFWKWWSFIILSIAVFFISNEYVNITNYILVLDKSKISMGISLLTIAASAYIGLLAYRLQFRQEKIHDTTIQPLWFISDTLLSLGMVGTLIGFMVVLTTTFNDIDTTSTSAMKRVIGELAAGMGIALITSLTGLIGSIILKFELVLLESENAKI